MTSWFYWAFLAWGLFFLVFGFLLPGFKGLRIKPVFLRLFLLWQF